MFLHVFGAQHKVIDAMTIAIHQLPTNLFLPADTHSLQRFRSTACVMPRPSDYASWMCVVPGTQWPLTLMYMCEAAW
jgi:hypothetical protein